MYFQPAKLWADIAVVSNYTVIRQERHKTNATERTLELHCTLLGPQTCCSGRIWSLLSNVRDPQEWGFHRYRIKIPLDCSRTFRSRETVGICALRLLPSLWGYYAVSLLDSWCPSRCHHRAFVCEFLCIGVVFFAIPECAYAYKSSLCRSEVRANKVDPSRRKQHLLFPVTGDTQFWLDICHAQEIQTGLGNGGACL